MVYALLAARWVLALLFLTTGVSKLVNRDGLVTVIGQYDLGVALREGRAEPVKHRGNRGFLGLRGRAAGGRLLGLIPGVRRSAWVSWRFDAIGGAELGVIGRGRSR
jgi:uncharacterized membrane protein YphA (DoxX/SURF4 family)